MKHDIVLNSYDIHTIPFTKTRNYLIKKFDPTIHIEFCPKKMLSMNSMMMIILHTFFGTPSDLEAKKKK